MEALKTKIATATASAHQDYLEQMQRWAEAQFQHSIEFYNRYMSGYFSTSQVTPRERYQAEKDYYNKHLPIIRKGLDAYIKKELKLAEAHYFAAVEKLAMVIIKKGLNVEKLSIEQCRVGVNLEVIISDGNQTIHAFTIIASGPIQRPHYRYLIK